MIDAPIWTVGPSRPDDGSAQQSEQRQQRLAQCDPQRDKPLPGIAIGQLASRDRLRDAAALRVREIASGQEYAQHEAGGRDHERDIVRVAEQHGEGALGPVGHYGERDCRGADRDAAQKKEKTSLPACRNHLQQTKVTAGADRKHRCAILSVSGRAGPKPVPFRCSRSGRSPRQ